MTPEGELHVEIGRLLATYADVVTRQAWVELDDLFAPDARIHVDTVTRPAVDLVGAAGLAEFVAGALAQFEFFQLVILNHVAGRRGDHTATGRAAIAELRQSRETHEWSTTFGRYSDEYVNEGERWRFAARSYRSTARRLGGDPAIVLPAP